MKRYVVYIIGRIVLPLVGVAVCLIWPPLYSFQPQMALGLALVAIGAVAGVFPARGWLGRGVHGLGAMLIWSIIGWCAMSQTAQVTEPLARLWSLRLLPVLGAFAIWGLMRLPVAWQRRALVALALPSAVGLSLVAWASPSQPPNFTPVYVVADSNGTLYVTDKHSPVIRVFAPDGSLRAKLRPGVASVLGLPGRGFEQPGPYNDPDRLGVTSLSTAQQSQYSYFDTDGIRFCGLGIDAANRVYVPDAERNRLLRFTPDGRADQRWPLSNQFVPTRGCIAVSGERVYLASAFGVVLQYDLQGRLLATWATPEPMRGNITVAPDGKAVYVLGAHHIYAIDPATGRTRALPITLGAPVANAYETIVAAPDGRLLYTNVATGRIDVYCDEQVVCGVIGEQGDWPGQFGQMMGLFQDGAGNVYAADATHHLVQRFSPSGHVTTLYWSPDDDEVQ